MCSSALTGKKKKNLSSPHDKIWFKSSGVELVMQHHVKSLCQVKHVDH